MKQERLAFLADAPFYTKGFAFYVGRRCRASPIRDVAQGAAARLAHREGAGAAVHARAAAAGRDARPRVIGLDEVSIKKDHTYRIVVMDMWKPFRLATARHAPQASILFDKFHVLCRLGDALDQVRKSEYARVSPLGRRVPDGRRGFENHSSDPFSLPQLAPGPGRLPSYIKRTSDRGPGLACNQAESGSAV